MENALQHALKEAIKNNTPAWYDDESSTQATEPVTQPETTKENIMQTTQTQLHLGEKVKKIYEMLVTYPNSSCVELEQRLRDAGHDWYDSLSGQLKQLYDRGLVVRIKRAGSDGDRPAYRYWPIANTFEEAISARKEAQRNKAATPPMTSSFPINKKKAVKEKAMHRLVPKDITRKVIPTQEIAEEPRQKVMLRVGGFDAKQMVERMSVIEARAVYAELKAIFG